MVLRTGERLPHLCSKDPGAVTSGAQLGEILITAIRGREPSTSFCYKIVPLKNQVVYTGSIREQVNGERESNISESK